MRDNGELQANDLLMLIENAIRDVGTCMVAKITKLNGNLINCQPVVSRVDKDGKKIDFPEFLDVPILVYQGGGSYIIMPASIGDYCLLIVADRSFDNWYNGKDFIEPTSKRHHNYSDCFALIGVNPKMNLIALPKKITMKGDAIQEGDYSHTGNREQKGNSKLDGDLAVNGNINQTGDQVVNGDLTINGTITILGNIACTGSVSCSGLSVGGKDYSSHAHMGVKSGTDVSGGVL